MTNDVNINASSFTIEDYEIPETKQYTKFQRFLMKHFSVFGIASFLWKIVRFVILIGLAFVVLFPFFQSIIDSFKGFQDFIDPTVRFIPRSPSFEHIQIVLTQIGGMRLSFGLDEMRAFFTSAENYRYLAESLGITVTEVRRLSDSFILNNTYFRTFWYSGLIAIIQVAVCALAGYGFARFKFIGGNILFFCVILSLVIPPQTLIIPTFVMFRFFPTGTFADSLGYLVNLNGTHWPGIILALTGLGIKNGLYIFMFRQFFKNMPKELEEASYIDGCNTFQTFFRVMLPSAVALMVTVFLLSFAWQWTDMTYSTIYMRGFQVLANSVGSVAYRDPEVDVMQAMYLNTAAILAVLPVGLVYLVGQRFFIQSVERSGITG